MFESVVLPEIIDQSDIEKIVFVEEPGEYRLIISKQINRTVKVEISSSDEWEAISKATGRQSKTDIVYSDTDTLLNFASVICLGIEIFLKQLTQTEYKEKWISCEFPHESYEKLREQLDRYKGE